MLRTLTHRGPDDEGIWVEPPAALGARRLAVIDVRGGHQPLSDGSGRYWIAYNGETYNYRELRSELEKEGARFRTSADTEVVVEWFARRGEEGLSRLNGMFAFALWDRELRILRIVRDPCGKKPAYYSELPEGIVFASELRTVASHPEVRRDLDELAVARYFAFDFVPSPATPLRSVRKLEPGTVLRWEAGRSSLHRFWKRPAGAAEPADLDERVRETLRGAVRRRLVSDVPLGVFLSGGIDSSTVAAMAREAGPVRTFSIAFDDTSYDESPYAQQVADHLSTEHVCERVSLREAAALAPEVLSRMDDLLADSSVIPTYMLSRTARRSVTVALGGDGGDELFAGYPTFYAHRVADRLAWVPRAVWRQAEAFSRALPVSHGYMSSDFVAARFFRGLAVRRDWRNQAWLGSFSPWDLERLLPEAPPMEAIYEDLGRFGATGDSVDRALAEMFRFYLGEGVLTKVDRASMLVSLEVRAPFLDHELIDLVCRVPWRRKLRGRTGKILLKRAVSGLLPPEILHRRKQGFAMPVARWLTEELREPAADFLGREGLRTSFVRRLWEEHQRRIRNRARELWSVFAFQIWKDAMHRWPVVASQTQ